MRIGVDARSLSTSLTGIGRYVHNICLELASQGHEIILYSHNKVIPSFDGHSSIQIKTFNFSSRALGHLWFQFYLPYLIRNDALDVFWGTAHKLPFFLKKDLYKLLTIHDLVWMKASSTMPCSRKILEQILMPHAIKTATRIITVSHSSENGLREQYPSLSDRLSTVYPGVTKLPEPEGEEALDILGIKHPYCLFVGTLEPRKNLTRLLEAFSKFKHRNESQVQLVIAGGKGWGKDDLENTLKMLGIHKDVIKLGYVSEKMLATLLAYSRFLAMPSLYEGFGLPIIESLSLGTPVLTSNTSSMPEVAGDAALLVDPYDIESITNAISKLFNDDSTHAMLKSRAKEVSSQFQWQKAAESIDKLLRA